MGPIFILGFPRTGTTAMASALSSLPELQSYSLEGHMFYFFSEGIERIRSGRMNPNSVLHDPDRRARFFDQLRAAFDTVFSESLATTSSNWIDKTPDIAQIRAVPQLRFLFPTAKFIFLYRLPEQSVRSNLATWPQQLEGKEEETARRWAQCARTWRQARAEVDAGDRVEVYQPDMLSAPGETADRIGGTLGLDAAGRERLHAFWRDNREINRPVGPAGERYDAVTLSPETLALVRRVTSDEVEHWPRLLEARAAD